MATQLIEIGVPLVLAFNMSDVALQCFYLTALAYIVTLVVYQTGTILL